MRKLVREHAWFFLGTALAGVALRLVFFFYVPAITDDSHIYADLATNWLRHGIYAGTQPSGLVLTDERLPGYPAFLAVVFALFGDGNFDAVLLLQIFVDLGTCLVVADLARRTVSDRAARFAFALACACPFLANYAAAALTETLEIFFTALALNLAVTGLDLGNANRHTSKARGEGTRAAAEFPDSSLSSTRSRFVQAWIGVGMCIGAGILLRPDGGILLVVVGLFLLWQLLMHRADRQEIKAALTAIVLVSFFALLPLVPWTIRNYRSLHHFQPLAPRYANEQEENVPYGFIRWVKTWIIDYASVEEFYWNMPGEKLTVELLPDRTFDTAEQRGRTAQLLDSYNQNVAMTPEIDAGFSALAAERIRAHPLRYYLSLPMLRVADMWLRPRTELLPPDPRWWEFNDLRSSSVMAVGFGIVNLLYVAAACLSLAWRYRALRYLGLFGLFLVLRSAFLGTIENPEPRYTLECYPVILLWAAAWLAAWPRYKDAIHQ